MRKSVLCFGELLWDLFPSGAELGGAPANFTFRMASLGREAMLVTRVGRDELGRKAIAELRGRGVNTAWIQEDPVMPSGTVQVVLDSSGEPDYTIVPGVAYDHIELTSDLETFAAAADCIYFGTLIQRADRSRETLRRVLELGRGAVKVLDLNLRKDCFTLETIRESLAFADVLKLNEGEASLLSSMLQLPADIESFAGEILNRFNLKYCVITLGPNGALACAREGDRNTTYCRIHGIHVSVRDTCGSGDAFTAGFVHKILERDSLCEACAFGNALGALVAGTKGAMTPIAAVEIDALAAKSRCGIIG